MTYNRLKTGATWHGHDLVGLTDLFGKAYFWIRDIDGTIYLAKVGEDGLPSLG